MVHRGQGQPRPAPHRDAAGTRYAKKNDTPILSRFDQLLEQCEISEQHAWRLRSHLLSRLVCLGRHSITGLITTSGCQHDDWSAHYRFYSQRRVEPQTIFGVLRRNLAAKKNSGPIVVALDDTRAKHTGRKIHGVKYDRDPMGPPFGVNFIRANRFLQLSMACPTQGRAARMVPVDFVHAPTPPKPSAKATDFQKLQYRRQSKQCRIGVVATERLDVLRRQLDDEGHAQRILWAAGDGGYTNGTVLRHLPRRTVFIGRIRADAKLYQVPQINPRGRRRFYGEPLPTPEQIRQDAAVDWQEVVGFAAGQEHAFKVKTIDAVRWRATGNQTLRLIIIAPLAYRLSAGHRLLYRQPAYLICTDPQASLEEVLQAYLWRWDIEVNFRDEKSLLGIDEAKVRDQDSVQTVPAMGVAAYGLMLLAGLDVAAQGEQPSALPLPKWRVNRPRPLCAGQLIAGLRHELWRDGMRKTHFVRPPNGSATRSKSNPNLASAVFYAVNSG